MLREIDMHIIQYHTVFGKSILREMVPPEADLRKCPANVDRCPQQKISIIHEFGSKSL